jgi:putative transposase
MSKKTVPIIVGGMYHVYNRGVDKRVVFEDKQDYLRFYQSLAYFNTLDSTNNFISAKRMYRKDFEPLVKIKSYCLLPNHFHLLIESVSDSGLSEFMKRVSAGYTSFFNEKYKRSGSLFQGTFKRKLIGSDEYKNYLIAYINENYVVHGLPTPTQVYESSKFHWLKIYKSMIISDDATETVTTYNEADALDLAHKIYKQRESLKSLLLEEE